MPRKVKPFGDMKYVFNLHQGHVPGPCTWHPSSFDIYLWINRKPPFPRRRKVLSWQVYLCLSKEPFQPTTNICIHLRLKGVLGLIPLPRDSHHLGAGPSTFVHFLIIVFSFMINAGSLFYRAYNLWQAGNKSMKWTSYSKRGIIVERSSWHKYMLEVIQTRGKLNTFPR